MQPCPRCQSMNAAEATVCVRCGAALPPQLAQAAWPTNPTGAPVSFAPSQPLAPSNFSGSTDPAPSGATTVSDPAADVVPPPASYVPPPPHIPMMSAPIAGAPYAPPGYVAPPSVPLAAPPNASGYAGVPIAPYQSPPAYIPTGVNPNADSYSSMGRPASPSQTLAGVLGVDAEPVTAQPSTQLQRSIMRNVSPRYAVNRWFMGALGALIAAGVGLLVTFLVQSFIVSLLSNIIDVAMASVPGGSLYSGIVKSLLTPDLLKMFVMEHRVPFDVTVGGTSSLVSMSGDVTIAMPVTGLLLIPAIALVIGGYISAASDFHRSALYSTMRGALVGPFYGIILAALAYFGSSSTNAQILGVSMDTTVSPIPWQAFFYGLLWGVIFGALGGWMQFAGSGFLRQAIPTLRARYGHTLMGGRIVGALSGSLVVVVAGMVACIGLLVAAVAYAVVYAAQAPGAASSGSSLSSLGLGGVSSSASPSASSASMSLLQLIVLFALIYAPTLAAYVFGLATGATFQIAGSTSVNSSAANNLSYGLFSGQHILPSTAPQWLYLVVLIPIVCYFAGGRVAARAAGAQTGGDGFVAGALMAGPASILMALLAYLTGLNLDASFAGQTANESISVSVGSIFLVTLLVGAVVGGIGGITATTAPALGSVFRVLVLPMRPLAGLVSRRLDAFTRLPQGARRSIGRQRLDDAILSIVGIGLVVVALDICNLVISPIVPFKQLVTLDAIVAALLIFVPTVLFIAALEAAFGGADGTATVPPASTFTPPLPATQGGPWPGQSLSGPGGQTGAQPSVYAAPSVPSVPLAGPASLYPGYPGYSGAYSSPAVASPAPSAPLDSAGSQASQAPIGGAAFGVWSDSASQTQSAPDAPDVPDAPQAN